MGHKHGNEKISLEALIRLKRGEQPDDGFWDSFEHDFQRRRLHALVEKDSLREKIRASLLSLAAVGVPVALFMAVALFWDRPELGEGSAPVRGTIVKAGAGFEVEGTGVVATAPAEENPGREDLRRMLEQGMASSQFVVDAIHADSDRAANFRKVLYSPALHISAPSGASYVRDSFSPRNYEVTTADVRLGRNF
jgi:hypothetical protein